ncbi:MAG: C4-type zinc ribbon domain-containing protein, partial [Candidatus Omnitrophica bacterium]|nr:C4-type zinc ribbon domain-containing protein [Candidatus Omnitrophota bacterium]
VKADISLIEDKILEILDRIDAKKIEIENGKRELVNEEQKFNTERSKIQARIKEIEDTLINLESQRKIATSKIESQILAQYERILKNREGLAIVKVNNNACQGCNMTVPPQVINLIKMYERIISCEICQRLLYLEEDL